MESKIEIALVCSVENRLIVEDGWLLLQGCRLQLVR